MLTTAQESTVSAGATRPIFIAEIAHGGQSELLSSSGSLIFDGRSFAEGGFNVKSIQDAQSARVELPWSIARVQEVQSGSWRGGICKIWAIIAGVDDPVGGEYTSDDGFLRLDGRIQASSLRGDAIQLTIAHSIAGSKISPRHTYNAVCSHIPASGTRIVWEGDSVTLESRR